MLALLQHWRIIATGIAVLSAFAAGWAVNGTRWEARWLEREVAIAAAANASAEFVREAVEAARAEEADQRRALQDRLTTVVTDAQAAQLEAERRTLAFQTQLRSLLDADPESQDWAATPLPTGVRGLLPGHGGDTTGDRGSSAGGGGADPR